jgi:histidine triad (HIT) family protein
MNGCLFCQIVGGEIFTHAIYEDEKTTAFLDVNPSAPGHTIIIPKEHYSNIQELPAGLVNAVFITVKTVSAMLEKAMGNGHFTIGFNNGRLSGQEIDHIHIHLIPRYKNDGGNSIQSVVKNSSEEDLEEIKNKIIRANG